MSLHSDILPKAYCDELMKLNSDVTPMPFDVVEDVIITLPAGLAGGIQSIEKSRLARLPLPRFTGQSFGRARMSSSRCSGRASMIRWPGISDTAPACEADAAGGDFPGTWLILMWCSMRCGPWRRRRWISSRKRPTWRFAHNNRDIVYVTEPKVYTSSAPAASWSWIIGGVPIGDVDSLHVLGLRSR